MFHYVAFLRGITPHNPLMRNQAMYKNYHAYLADGPTGPSPVGGSSVCRRRSVGERTKLSQEIGACLRRDVFQAA